MLDSLVLHVTNLNDMDEMLFVERMALLCTRKNPIDRPTMNEVVEMFTSLSQRNKNGMHDGNKNGMENV